MRLSGLTLACCWLTACGSRFGSVNGKPLHTRMTAKDLEIADRTFQRALETIASGMVLEWRNEGSGNSGSITPVRTYRTSDGTFCREYREVVRVGIESETYLSVACRLAGWNWQSI